MNSNDAPNEDILFTGSTFIFSSCSKKLGAKRAKKSPKAHTKTDTSSQEKLFGEIQNSF